MTIPITRIPPAGIDLGALAAAEDELQAALATDTIPWPTGASSIFLLVKTGATATNIGVASQAPESDGLVHDDKDQAVEANKHRLIEISQAFRDDDGNVTVTASGARTNVVLGAFYL